LAKKFKGDVTITFTASDAELNGDEPFIIVIIPHPHVVARRSPFFSGRLPKRDGRGNVHFHERASHRCPLGDRKARQRETGHHRFD
jgi:hypothetical protein